MAVELQYRIEIDASQAKTEAAATEQALQDTTKAAADLGTVSGKTEAQLKLIGGALSVARLEAGQLTAAEKTAIDASRQLGDSIQATAQKTGIAADTIRVYTQSVKESNAQSSTFLETAKRWATGGAIIAAIKASADWADRIQELSVQTGIGITALQKFDNAAKQNGSSIEQLASAQGFFQNAIETGSKKVSDAVSRLGLDFNTLKMAAPEDQMRMFADAITGVKDPTEKAAIATELFGRSGRALIPTLEEIAKNYDRLPAASEEAIKQTGSLSDTFVRAKDAVLRFVTEAISPLVEGLGFVGGAFDALWNSRGFVAIRQFLPDARKVLFLPLAETIDNFKLVFGEIEQPSVKMANGFEKLVASAKAASAQGLPDVVRLAQKGGDVLGYAALQERELNEELKRTQAAAREAAKAHGDLNGSLDGTRNHVRTLTEEWQRQITAARGLVTDVNTGRIALDNLGAKQGEVNKKALEGAAAMQAMHLEGDPLYNDLLHIAFATANWSKELPKIKDGIDGVILSANRLPDAWEQNDIAIGNYVRRSQDIPLAALGLRQVSSEVKNADDAWAESLQRMQARTSEFRNMIGDLARTVNENFAAMLTGTESFSQGFGNIWSGIKQTAIQILSDILAYYEKVFIARFVLGMSTGGASWSQALAGAFSGGSGGTGGGGLLGSALGGGGATAGGLGAGTVIPSADAAAASSGIGASGAGSGAGLGTALAGGAVIGGAGLGLGLLGTQIFGGAGWKASGFGAATGAGAGALIGTFVFPGIGTGVGAAIGAVAGAIGGWIGKSVGEKINDARDEFLKQFGEPGTGAGSAFHNINVELERMNELGIDGAKIQKEIFQPDDWDDFNDGVQRLNAAFQDMRYIQDKVNTGFQTLQDQAAAAVSQGMNFDDVIQKQAADYSVLYQTIARTGAQAPEGLQPLLQSLIDMGLLLDANGAKVQNLDVLTGAFNDITGAAKDAAKAIDNIPDVHIRTIMDAPDSGYYPGGTAISGAARGGYVTDHGVQYLAGGGVTMGRVLGFRSRGTDTVPAMLTPGEGVLSRRGMSALGALNSGHVSGGDVNVTIKISGSVITNRQAMGELAEELSGHIMNKLSDRKKFGRRIA